MGIVIDLVPTEGAGGTQQASALRHSAQVTGRPTAKQSGVDSSTKTQRGRRTKPSSAPNSRQDPRPSRLSSTGRQGVRTQPQTAASRATAAVPTAASRRKPLERRWV